MDTKGPSSSSSSSHKWKYDVFLSFRGEDTRKNFTDHLYSTLKQKGINAFRDDKNLERGEPISPMLLNAIEESLFAIVILSKNYASSTWCLDELVKIMECKKKMGQIVLPIFYDVDPSEVRKQTGAYAQAFEEHEKRFKENIGKVHMWRAILTEVANLSGFPLQDRHESEFIQDIVEEILHKLSYTLQRDTDDLVAIDSLVEKLMKLLAIESNDVRIIGIWGMGGIGKTTLARVVYQKIFNDFEGGSFITNIGEEFERHGLLPLQQKLICEILRERSTNIRDVDDGVLMIKNRLSHKRILLVLDDVNQFNQLEKLVGKLNWFGPGSRVIITTRDKHLLIRHNVFEIYEVEELNDDDALRLFSLKAFKREFPDKDYLELSIQFVNYAKGLPLAIEVLGSFLIGRGKEEWKSELERLIEFPNKEIINIFQRSFDGLQETDKEIFLHIACFFNRKRNDYVVEILDYLGFYPEIGLKVLIERSLLKDLEGKFQMHDILQKMGQNIVRRDYPLDPGRWSRLWLYEDIRKVLTKNSGTEAIQGLVLELPRLPKVEEQHKSEKAHWNLEAFSKMSNLKLLIINDVHILHSPKYLPLGLKCLHWSEYPLKSLPSSFQLDELVELCMFHSKIKRLWKGIKRYGNLKSIKLEGSLNLIATPNVTGVPSLKKLVFKGCINLRKIHPSILVHKRLTLLNLENCEKLSSFPCKFEMESLEILILSGCSKIKRIPEFMRNMEHLSKLYLDGTAITKLPSSIEHMTNLDSLHLRDCKNLVCLPSVICSFKSLKNINLAGCSKLDNLPENLWNNSSLEVLDVSRITLKELPSLPSLHSLVRLDLSDCNIVTIPINFGYLPILKDLNLSGNNFDCLPKSISQLSRLVNISLENCTRLRSLPQLPSNTGKVLAQGCTTLETLPNVFHQFTRFHLFNCFKLADNQGWTEMFFSMLSGYAQGIKVGLFWGQKPLDTLNIVIPGSEIPRWFSHQSAGVTVNAHATHPSHSRNNWIGIAVCAVFSPRYLHPEDVDIYTTCEVFINGFVSDLAFGFLKQKFVRMESDHLWLLYLHPECVALRDIEKFSQTDENGFIHISFRFSFGEQFVGKKCGFRMVYKRDIEEIREMMAQSSTSSCIVPYERLRSHAMPIPSNHPYEGIDADAQHDFDNLMVATESNNNGAGPSGEGSSNDIPHRGRIQIPHSMRIIKKVRKTLRENFNLMFGRMENTDEIGQQKQ